MCSACDRLRSASAARALGDAIGYPCASGTSYAEFEPSTDALLRRLARDLPPELVDDVIAYAKIGRARQ